MSVERKEIAVVVTGVGAVIGCGIVEGLRRSGRPVKVLGVDRNPGCVGRDACDEFYAKPRVSEESEAYLDFWRGLAEEADLVLPGIDEDVFYLDVYRGELTATRLGLNSRELIDLARDKWLQIAAAEEWAIPTVCEKDWEECVELLGPPPLLLKPRCGSGSRGIVRLENAGDLARHADGFNMIQRIVGEDDSEFTVGMFGLGGGRSMPPLVFRRELSASGHTQFAEVVEDNDVAGAAIALGRRLRPVGPTNYQFRQDGTKTWLLEINPRFSSTTAMRAAFGYNEAAMALDFYLDEREPDIPTVQKGRARRVAADQVELEFDSRVDAGH